MAIMFFVVCIGKCSGYYLPVQTFGGLFSFLGHSPALSFFTVWFCMSLIIKLVGEKIRDGTVEI